MAGGLLFPHTLLVTLITVTGFGLNVFSLLTGICGRERLNTIELLQTIKRCFVLVAFVICVPLGADLYEERDQYNIIVYNAFKDITDILLIHSKPVAFLVISILQYRLRTCRRHVIDVMTSNCALVIMAVSMIPSLCMVTCRMALAVYDVFRFKTHVDDVKKSGWTSSNVFDVVRLCVFDALPLFIGLLIYIAAQCYLPESTVRVNDGRTNTPGQLGDDALQCAGRCSPWSTQSSRSLSLRRNSITWRTNTVQSNLLQENTNDTVSTVVLLLSVSSSWIFCITIEALFLAKSMQLTNVWCLYGKLAVLTFDPIGDGVFFGTKRDNFRTCWRRWFSRNSVGHCDEISMEVTTDETHHPSTITQKSGEKSSSVNDPYQKGLQLLCMQSCEISTSIFKERDGRKTVRRLSRKESKISFCSELSVNDYISSEEVICKEIAIVDESSVNDNVFDDISESEYEEAFDTSSLYSRRSRVLDDIMQSIKQRRYGAKCPSPTRSSPTRLSSECSSWSNRFERQSSSCLSAPFYVSGDCESEQV